MKDWKSALCGLHPHLLAWIWSALLVMQMVLAFFVFGGPKIQESRLPDGQHGPWEPSLPSCPS